MRRTAHTIAMSIALLAAGTVRADPSLVQQLVSGIKAVMLPTDSQYDGVLTVYDNNLYVQCLNSHFLRAWRCEAAGFEGQPWLHNVLTVTRQQKLADLGFKPDPEFGNFVAQISESTAPERLSGTIITVMAQVYGVKPDDLSVKAERLKSARCHLRILPGHDRGALIRTPTLGFDQDTASTCHATSDADALNYDDPSLVMPTASGIDVDARYLGAITAELERLEAEKKGSHAYVIFDAGPAYVQCQHDIDGNEMYCEAASEDAAGKPIERILTPGRKAILAKAGFSPPGKVMNYSRMYPRDQFDMAATAKALLDVLKNAYGYQGAPAMNVQTAKGPKRPLVP